MRRQSVARNCTKRRIEADGGLKRTLSGKVINVHQLYRVEAKGEGGGKAGKCKGHCGRRVSMRWASGAGHTHVRRGARHCLRAGEKLIRRLGAGLGRV